MSFDASQYVKSDWLHGSDLPNGQPVQASIKAAYEHSFDDGTVKPVVEFYEMREKLALNKTQTRALIELFGANAGGWVGQTVEMLAVPSNFQGKPTIAIKRGAPQGAPSVSYQGQDGAQPVQDGGAPQQQQPIQQQPEIHYQK